MRKRGAPWRAEPPIYCAQNESRTGNLVQQLMARLARKRRRQYLHALVCEKYVG